VSEAVVLDENLILRMGRGDGAAFRDLYDQTSGIVYGFALSILRNRHDAEDVMHDAFIKVYQSAVTYRPMGKPLAWILTIVRNLSYNKMRAGTISEDIADYENVLPAADDGTVDRLMLREALGILDFEERQIVILHALTGLKHREIAEILELPLGTVTSKYNRALKKMREAIDGKGEPDGQ